MAKCKHGRPVCAECVVITDAAKRMSDGTKLIATTTTFMERAHGWIAVALADGSVDYNLYPSKAAAVAHQSNEFLYAYLCLRNSPGGMSPKDAQIWLDLHRYMYDNGYRLTGERTVIMPQAREHLITHPVEGSDVW